MAIRHSITLSTSEPNNEVGNLKIRQGDEQTQTLVANITENGVPKPFVGLQPFFCAKLGQTAGLGIVEQKVTGTMNPANGTLEYVMQPEDWQKIGRQTGYFSFRKMKNAHEWTEQFSTRDFAYNVIPSAIGEIREVKKDGSTYVWTIEDMLRLFKEYMATGKVDWENYKNDERTTWEKFVEDNREFLETADPGGKIILELLGARNGAESLGERLDESDAQLAQTPTNSNIITPIGYTRMIAHRGLNVIAPENSLPACELAGQHGFWGVETDVQITSDGEWVVMHDATVDRTTNGSGNVADMTLAEIKALNIDVGNNIELYPNLKVPTLREFLFECKRVGVVPVVEIKNTPPSGLDYDNLINIIKEVGLEDKSIIISFNSTINHAIRSRSTKIVIQPLTTITQNNLDDIKGLGNAGIDVYYKDLTKELVELAHDNGILVNCWTVNDINTANGLIDMGVDFISTDKLIMGVAR